MKTSLELRLKALEENINGQCAVGDGKLEQTKALTSKYENLLKQNRNLDEYLKLYKSVAHLIENEGAYSALDLETKLEIINASESLIENMRKELEYIENNKHIVDGDHYTVLIAETEKLIELEASTKTQRETVEALYNRIQNVSAKYNEIVEIISLQFLQWDEQLKKMEDKLDIIEAN